VLRKMGQRLLHEQYYPRLSGRVKRKESAWAESPSYIFPSHLRALGALRGSTNIDSRLRGNDMLAGLRPYV
jgi:hypothetical protein